MIIRPVVKYHGGKGRLHKWISTFIPTHNIYCEPFGGAASVLLNKVRCQTEIYNDLESSIVNLLQIVRDEFELFVTEIKKLEYNKETYLLYRNLYLSNAFQNLSPLEKAISTYVVKRMSRGGRVGTFSWSSRIYSTGPAEVHCWSSAIDNLALIHERLQNVELLCGDALSLLKKYDCADLFCYLDPPYLHETRESKNVYSCEMSDQAHQQLLDFCLSAKSKILISGYPSDLYHNKLKDWRVEKKLVANHSSHRKIKSVMSETLWANF